MNTTYDVRHRLDGADAYLKFSETSEELRVEVVFVPLSHRKRKIGRLLMSRVLALADAVKKPIRLVARPLGVTSAESLESLIGFYEALGFRVVARLAGAAEMERPVPGEGSR
jgi:GNAT superfamily N-acetyltransferase